MSSSNAALVKLSGIQKMYRAEHLATVALAEVHLEIQSGDYVVIEGPSGSGKTTLLSLIGLLDAATSGEYFLRGRAVSALSGRERSRIRNREVGFIFQTFNLIGELTVWENVELPLIYRNLGAAERRKLVNSALERVQLAHRRDYLPSQLSGGQQQRVAVARAVAGQPSLLLADEPTGSLDSKSGDAVMDLLGELHASGSTVCMVTHNVEYARRARRVIRLFDGRVIEDTASARGQRAE